MTFEIARLKRFPTDPGVYLMKNRTGKVLYIGKAKNLRNRVRQYFMKSGDSRPMIPRLIGQVESIDTIVVRSEKEALLVENTLIKQHQPKYNVLLKDDKTYVSLKVTKHQWPMIQLVRYKGKLKRDGTYFGPYTSTYSAKRTLEIINRVFPLRQCSDTEFVGRTRPCILYGMGRCCAPCVRHVNEEEYGRHVERAMRFLRGDPNGILKELKAEMQSASDAMEFEKAAALLASVRAIEETVQVQTVFKAGGGDRDVFGLHREGGEVTVTQMVIRTGRLVGAQSFTLSDVVEEDADLLESLLLQKYIEGSDRPKEILIPVRMDGGHVLSEVIDCRILHPQRGEKKRLIEMACRNAESVFVKERDEAQLQEKMLLTLQEKLRLMNYPRRIECFDTSNISGTEPVAAMIAFTAGVYESARTRKYKVKTTTVSDDYQAMYEVLNRRYRKGKEENDLPDLIIVDGGKGQLNIAVKVLRELDITGVDIIGLAKEQARHDKGLSAEQVFLPGIRDALHLGRHSSVLFFLQKIRDEAHRVAIGFHRQRRQKGLIRTSLDVISGIGPVKQKSLLKHFGSIKRMRSATDEELLAVKGIGPRDVAAIRNHYKDKE